MILISNKCEVHQNAVDFLLAKFPPKKSSKETDMFDEDEVALPVIDDPIQESDETENVAVFQTYMVKMMKNCGLIQIFVPHKIHTQNRMLVFIQKIGCLFTQY